MANRKIMWGIVGVSLVFGLVLAGCATNTSDEPNTDPKTIVITGFNLELQNGLEFAIRETLEGPLIGRRWISRLPPGNGPRDVSMELIDMDTTASGTHPENGEQPWTGTGNYFISFNPGGNSRYFYSVDGTNPAKYYIKDAVTKLAFVNFVKEQD
jgi:hypothetical protein